MYCAFIQHHVNVRMMQLTYKYVDKILLEVRSKEIFKRQDKEGVIRAYMQQSHRCKPQEKCRRTRCTNPSPSRATEAMSHSPDWV